MQLKITNKYTKVESTSDLETVVHSFVNQDCDSGALERIESRIRRQTDLLLRVLTKLNLTSEELTEWIGEWNEEITKE